MMIQYVKFIKCCNSVRRLPNRWRNR